MPRSDALPDDWTPDFLATDEGIRRLREVLGPAWEQAVPSTEAMRTFPVRLTREWLTRIRPGDAQDPLLLQIWPAPEETLQTPGFGTDPVGDQNALLRPGLLQKYAHRALLITTGACAIHCRYCFRRAFPYAEAQMSHSAEASALEAIRADESLSEIILSGGDPLMLSDERLQRLIDHLQGIPHLCRLRIHTRMPIVAPARITAPLCAALRHTRLAIAVVIHSNHAHELDGEVVRAITRLRETGAVLLNQSVLLRTINDSAGTLADLSTALFAAGVLPYYLHLLDRAQGTAHFEVAESAALDIMDALRARLPGYLVPRLVREEAGQRSKIPIERDAQGRRPGARSAA